MYSKDVAIRLIRRWKERLFLHAWTIHVEWGDTLVAEGGEMLFGAIAMAPGRLEACLRLHSMVLQDWDELHCTVVHELTHVAVWKMKIVTKHLEPLLGQPAYEVFAATFDEQMEQTVEQIAQGMALAFPDNDLKRPRRRGRA